MCMFSLGTDKKIFLALMKAWDLCVWPYKDTFGER